MIGFCGIDCARCGAYQATVTGDESRLKAMAAKLWDGAFKPEEWVCLGCNRENKDFIAAYCGKCQIRKCALEANIPNCAACLEFESCRRLHDFIANEDKHLRRMMGWLRQRYLANREYA